MATRQGEHERKLENPDEAKRQHRKAASGDVSGQGRERRDDSDVYPAGRSAGDFGTHGGQNKHGAKSRA